MKLGQQDSRSVLRYSLHGAVFLGVVALVGAVLLSGGAVAHDDGDGLTVHNQTKPLDQHGEIHTLRIDKATADTDFYVDLHTDSGTINTTRTFEAGTVKENLDVVLDPTITSDAEVTVAIHAANGTELTSETVTVDVVDAPTVSFADQVHELDEHGEVHTITVDHVAANQDYYVDVHTEQGTINKTRTFEGGTTQTDLSLTLDPTLKATSEVTVAVHAVNGTELAAETATVTTADVQFANQTRELDQHDEVHTISVEQVSVGTSYYVDVHTEQGTINTTRTFEAGTTMENLKLSLDPTITSDTEVTVAVHATDGTELAANTAMVSVTDGTAEEQTEATPTEQTGTTSTSSSDDEGTATEAADGGSTETSTAATGPGFGATVAIIALVGAAFIARRFHEDNGE